MRIYHNHIVTATELTQGVRCELFQDALDSAFCGSFQPGGLLPLPVHGGRDAHREKSDGG